METIKRWRVGDCDRLEKERDTLRAQLDAAHTLVAELGRDTMRACNAEMIANQKVTFAAVGTVIEKLRSCGSCAASVIESQTCGSTITAKWAARELRRILKQNALTDECIAATEKARPR